MTHRYPTRQNSEKKASSGQNTTSNNNHRNNNDRSQRSTAPTESNYENNSPPAERWQAHPYGMELHNNSGLFSDQHQEGIVDESSLSWI
jgi:hypothetical protein